MCSGPTDQKSRSPPFSSLPSSSPPRTLAAHCPTEMSRWCQAIREEAETHSVQQEEEARGLREQLGRVPQPPSEARQGRPERLPRGSFSRRLQSLLFNHFPPQLSRLPGWDRGCRMSKVLSYHKILNKNLTSMAQ